MSVGLPCMYIIPEILPLLSNNIGPHLIKWIFLINRLWAWLDAPHYPFFFDPRVFTFNPAIAPTSLLPLLFIATSHTKASAWTIRMVTDPPGSALLNSDITSSRPKAILLACKEQSQGHESDKKGKNCFFWLDIYGQSKPRPCRYKRLWARTGVVQ